MPLDAIVVGLVPGDRKGDTIRNAFVKTNANFNYVEGLYTSLNSLKGAAGGIATLDQSGVLVESQVKNSGVTAGTYPKVTVDAKGRVTSGSSLAATDIPSLDTSKLTTGSLPVARGGTGLTAAVQGAVMYGSSTTAAAFTAAGTSGQVLRSNGTAAPTWVTLDLTYLPDAAFKKSVKAATTANITLSGTQTVDGIALVAGDRVLVKDQTTASQNGIYVVSASTWTRATDADAASEIAGGIVNVDSGTTNGGVCFTTYFKTTDTLGTAAMSWERLVDTGMASAVAGMANGTAAAGTSQNYARADHVHPLQTTVSGNAGTATKLATARTLSLTGDATGSASFDGSANASIAVTIANKDVANGIPTLDASGLIKTSQLPSYVDDVVEYANLAGFPATGSTGKIFVALDTNIAYRWSGSTYIPIASGGGISDAAVKLQTARSISMTGDGTWTTSFDGSGNVTGAMTLANSGVTAGSYAKVTVNAKGLVTAGTTLAAADIPALDTSKLTTGTLAVARGGTGLTTLTQGGIMYGSSTTAAAITAAGTSGQVLVSNGTSAPTWVTLDLAYMPDASVKKNVRAATTADLDAATFASGVLTGKSTAPTVACTTTAGSTTVTTAAGGTALIKVGAVVSTATTQLAAGTTVASIASATSFTVNNRANIATTAITGDGTTATATFAAQTYAPYAVGSTISVSGTVPATYNGSFVVTACTTTSVSWASTETTAATTQGSIAFSIAAGTSVNTVFAQTIAGLTVDGITPGLNDRVLVKNQTTPAQNGIYYLSTLGTTSVPWVLTRATDADTANKLAGAVVNVGSGTTNGGIRFDNDFKTTDSINVGWVTWSRIVDTGMAGTAVGAALGTAAAGTSEKYAREDHVHPAPTTISGNAGTATKLATARTINGVGFDGSANITIADSTKLPLAGGTLTGTLIQIGVTKWQVSAVDMAVQRCDARDEATDYSRLHWYGESAAGATSNFRHAWYDGGAYINVTADAGAVTFGGSIYATGNVTAYSDLTLKENVQPVSNATYKVNQLNGVTFTRNDLQDKSKRYIGLIAQDVQKVAPEAIAQGENGKLAVDYQGLVGLLVESIKEMDYRLKLMEEHIKFMESRDADQK